MSDAIRYLLDLLHKGWAYTDAATLTATLYMMDANEIHDQYVAAVPTPMRQTHAPF